MKKLVLIMLFPLLLTACGKDDDSIYLTVASERPERTTVDEFSFYYFVKYGQSTEWEVISTPIVGLDYEPGYEYEIEVREVHLKNPPQDYSSVEYRLLRLISKTEKESEDLP